MGYLATFIVGALLGWLASWILQKRLDDNLHDEVARLQRKTIDYEREIEKLRAPALPAATAVAAAEAELGSAPVAERAVAETIATEVVAEAVYDDEATTVVMDRQASIDLGGEGESPPAEELQDMIYPAGDVAAGDDEVIVVLREEGGSTAAEELPEMLHPDAEAEAEEAAAWNADTRNLEVAALPSAPAGISDEAAVDLTVIKGIGPKFAETLNSAGITTYADLANTPPEKLQEIVAPAAWQKVDFEDWVAQASALSRQSRRMQIGDDLTRLEGIGPTYAQQLRAAGITTFAELAQSDEESLARVIDAPAWRKVAYGAWIAQARLAEAGDEAGLKKLQEQLFSREGDNIGLIQGIGATTLAALNDGGITTYAQLAAATPEQLAEILSASGVRRGDFEAWIAEAKLRAAGKRVTRGSTRARAVPVGGALSACPQDLGRIEGIGETYEQRLYAVGIGTYWEVSMLQKEDLSDILEIKAFQDVNLDAIQASARSLAEETNSVGRVWDGTEPDDFEILEGIGEVFEQRLYDAGICTFAALAELTEERLQEICQARPNFVPNFRLWLQQARESIG